MQRAGLRDVRVHWLPILPAFLQPCQPLLETRIATLALRHLPLLGLLSSHAFIISARKP